MQMGLKHIKKEYLDRINYDATINNFRSDSILKKRLLPILKWPGGKEQGEGCSSGRNRGRRGCHASLIATWRCGAISGG